MKGKLARVKYDINLYKHQVITERPGGARTDDLVIIINTDSHCVDEYFVHHQKLGKQYYISKWALEVLG